MKKLLISAALPTMILVTGCVAQTATLSDVGEVQKSVVKADAKAEPKEPISRSAPHSKKKFVETYDTDGDGVVSMAEFMAERKAGYDLRDANSDGTLHEEEYVAEYEARLKKELKERYEGGIKQAHIRFNILDKDDDKAMTLDEFNASGKNIFATLDTNGDGIIDDADTETHY